MNLYELTYLTSPEFTAEEILNFHEKITANIVESKGDVKGGMKPLKKTLAYPVKKQIYGYLASINFEIEKENLKEIKKMIEKELKVVRYIIISKNHPSEEKDERVPRKKMSLKPSKTNLEDIDAKIEEIL